MHKQQLPNATLILILGILSIIGCCFYSIPGFILGIITLIIANGATKEYNQSPDSYSGYENVKAGKIMAIIGISLSLLFLAMLLALISYIGWAVFQDPELMRQKLEELQNMQ